MNFTNFMLLSTLALVAATSVSAEGSDALYQLRGTDAVQVVSDHQFYLCVFQLALTFI